MPLVTNEQSEKKQSLFLKYESENNLIIRSNLYRISCHFIKSLNRSIACQGEDCIVCAKGYQKKVEYNYYVNLNGQDGVMDIKPSVFFAINQIEKAIKKDKRNISWLIIRSGSGLDTEYTTSKDDNLAVEDIEKSEKELPTFNEKLEQVMGRKEESLEADYKEHAESLPKVEVKKKVSPPKTEEKAGEGEENEEPKEEVSPDDVPF